MELYEIKRLIREGQYEFSLHAQQERLEENLDITEIEEAILHQGEIREDYPDDPRGESCLVLGVAGAKANPCRAGMGAKKGREGESTEGDYGLSAEAA